MKPQTEGAVNPGMILDEELILEIVRPGTGDPVAAGEVGEVVITSFNPDYPLIRFATGDLSALLAGVSPCGRTNTRIKGWMGRADQTTKVRAMFVHPSQVAEIARRHPEILKARLVVSGAMGNDVMTLHCEVADPAASASLAAAIVDSIRDITKLRGEVQLVRARQPAERRQGDRGRAQLRIAGFRRRWRILVRCRRRTGARQPVLPEHFLHSAPAVQVGIHQAVHQITICLQHIFTRSALFTIARFVVFVRQAR